ncbi:MULTISPECIES: ABC transporter permease [unclassified Neorhizobium]|uniref:ABC transporter permease n=1 Tax=unclassified Neorhizobium TaxID=2629175 RepID=UPI001FF47085|nr:MULTISPECIES: ABC transporter permease [unclassified Neorhizobium]MCJ9672812.1 ABC transporter permease [Neorhizobium sp. SHOUNA12B]MCJ9748447.1 ABC transporter permease [Neorhizobium sp. SHOUNA12A]
MFFRTSYLSFKGLFLWLTPWGYFSSVIVAPVLNYLLFVLISDSVSDPNTYRSVVLNVPFYSASTVIAGGVLQMFFYERAFGILEFESKSPLYAFWAKSLCHLPNGILSITVSLLIAVWLHPDAYAATKVPTLAVCVIAMSISIIAFCMMLGVVVSALEEWLPVLSLGSATLFLLTGVLIPTSSLPQPLGVVSAVLPMTHGLIAYRQVVDGFSGEGFSTSITSELTVAMLYVILASAGWLALRRLRRSSRLPL